MLFFVKWRRILTCFSYWNQNVTSVPRKQLTESIRGCKGAPGTRPPPGSKFFHFHAVFGKIWPNNRLAPPPWGLTLPSMKSWFRHWKGWNEIFLRFSGFIESSAPLKKNPNGFDISDGLANIWRIRIHSSLPGFFFCHHYRRKWETRLVHQASIMLYL